LNLTLSLPCGKFTQIKGGDIMWYWYIWVAVVFWVAGIACGKYVF